MEKILIESFGINFLENFLLKSERINPAINKMDKYPIWDGELLLYHSNKFDKNNFECRVPIQVKCELLVGEKRTIESYSINIEDLKKYYDEGGVLFIKVIYDNKKQKGYIYIKKLLNSDINDILFNVSENQKSKKIELSELINPQDIINICKNFNLHRKYQMQLSNFLSVNLDENSELHSFGYINTVNDILKEEQYVYIKTNYNSFAYVGKLKYLSLCNTHNVEIGTRTKTYYKNIEIIYQEDQKIVKINNHIRIMDDKILINIGLINDSYIETELYDLEFLLDLYENKNIKIGDMDYIDLIFEDDEEKLLNQIKIIRNNINYFRSASAILKSLNIPLNVLKIRDVIKEEANVCKVDKIINKGQLINLSNTGSKIIIDSVDILGIEILIYFIKQDDGVYRGYDYLHDDLVYKKMVITDKEPIQLSRYFNLPSDVLVKLALDENALMKEMKLCTKNEVTVFYINNLMLEFIKAYDMCNDRRYLKIAEKINSILRKQRQYYSEQLYKINKFQILKRIGNLTQENIASIVKMEINEKENYALKCSCCLLLDRIEDFVLYYDYLDSDTKMLFKKWAIFKFFPVHYLKRIDKTKTNQIKAKKVLKKTHQVV